VLNSYPCRNSITTLIISICPTGHPSVHPSTDLQPLLDFGPFFSSLSYTQSVGFLVRGISPSQGRYLHTVQHKYRINAHRHPCLEWDSSPRSQQLREDSPCLRQRGHCDLQFYNISTLYYCNNRKYKRTN
jgi:hypothetical protein